MIGSMRGARLGVFAGAALGAAATLAGCGGRLADDAASPGLRSAEDGGASLSRDGAASNASHGSTTTGSGTSTTGDASTMGTARSGTTAGSTGIAQMQLPCDGGGYNDPVSVAPPMATAFPWPPPTIAVIPCIPNEFTPGISCCGQTCCSGACMDVPGGAQCCSPSGVGCDTNGDCCPGLRCVGMACQ
jgi:hypothetical protein